MVGRPKLTPEEKELSKERRRAWDRERHKKHKEKRNLARRLAHARNPERLRRIERQRYALNPSVKKRTDVKSKYGEKGLRAFDSIHECQSCGNKVSGRNKHLDHDHSLPRKEGFRGVLCSNCNVALGYLKNDERKIQCLLKYLQQTKETVMKKVKNMAAQGDVMFIRVKSIPSDAVEAEAESGKFIVAHSETGHHHVIDSRNATMLIDKTNSFIAYLKITKDSEVKHERSFDTHKSLVLSPGNYEVRRQREYLPQGFRRVMD